MNMKKSSNRLHRKYRVTPAQKIFFLCFPLIFLCLWMIFFEVSRQAQFSAGTAAYYGKMMEYPIAALALLTAGVYLAERIYKAGK